MRFHMPRGIPKADIRELDWTLLAFWTAYLGAYAIGAIEVIGYYRGLL